MRFVVALLAVLLAGPALAQTPAEKRAAIGQMLDALGKAPNEEMAAALERRLRRLQIEASTPAVILLMGRGLRDVQAGQYDDAIEVFTDAITLDPDHAEAWHQRAVARFRRGDSRGAVRDLKETLRREPRSFAAFRTLTEIAVAREDWGAAHAAWGKVLEIAPKLPNAEERLRELRRKALGEDA